MYLARRLLQVIALLAVLSAVLFYTLHLMPGSAEDVLFAGDPSITEADLQRVRTLRGLDRPIHERYVCWLIGRTDGRCRYWPAGGFLSGDLGYSRVHKQRVSALVGGRLANTMRLMLPAFIIALLVSLSLGIVAARRPNGWLDRAIAAVSFAGLSLPIHWVGLVAILLFSVSLGWFPAGGVQDPHAPGFVSRVHHAALPVALLSLFYIGRWTRHVRSALLEVVNLDFIRAARAKGLSERTVFVRHALANAAIPIVTVVSQSIPSLFSGALVTERVFAYPGMGLLIFDSVVGDDYLAAMTVFMIFAALTSVASLIADVAYWMIDPRIRLSGGAP